ncbi:MAG: glyoxalase [Bacteroidetes bacterium]|nr:MAG: glyoxalase [Bacteroidota bacterium]
MKIEHIAMWVRNLEAMKDFYTTYFGAIANEKYSNPKKLFESYFLKFDDGARLEIMKMPTIPDSTNDVYSQSMGLIHFAISVGSRENVDALTDRLRQDGYEVVDGPRQTGDGYYESVILDPEQNRIEITI